MAEGADAQELYWYDPPVRAIIPLDGRFHVPQRLRRRLRQRPYDIRLNTAFPTVIRACAAPAPDRPTTWINEEIVALYTAMHQQGSAHSVEAWENNALVGGLYGVSLGGAFFGESMFSRRPNASKISLVYLVALLRACGFDLLDTQFQTPHLSQFGTFEIARAAYHEKLATALTRPARLALPEETSWDHLVAAFLQPITHTS